MSCGVRQTFGIMGFYFQVVSSNYKLPKLQNSIYEYIKKIPTYIKSLYDNMNDLNNIQEPSNKKLKSETPVNNIESLKAYIISFIEKNLLLNNSLCDSAKSHWSEISENRYDLILIFREISIVMNYLNSKFEVLGNNIDCYNNNLNDIIENWKNYIHNEIQLCDFERFYHDFIEFINELLINNINERLVIVQCSNEFHDKEIDPLDYLLPDFECEIMKNPEDFHRHYQTY